MDLKYYLVNFYFNPVLRLEQQISVVKPYLYSAKKGTLQVSRHLIIGKIHGRTTRHVFLYISVIYEKHKTGGGGSSSHLKI